MKIGLDVEERRALNAHLQESLLLKVSEAKTQKEFEALTMLLIGLQLVEEHYT